MNSLFERIRQKFNQQRDSRFIAALNSAQQADVGISNTDLQSLASNPPDTRDRMEAMASAHGLDANAIGREHWREIDMARACGQCSDRRTCSKWLAGRKQGLSASSFCPNASHFAELAKLKDPAS